MSRRIEVCLGAVFVLALVGGANGCKTPPTAWQTNPPKAARTACGSFTRMVVENDQKRGKVEGELLAVASSVVYVHDGEYLYVVPRGMIQRTSTFYSDTWDGAVGLWTLGGAISGVSHGLFALLSIPIWLVSGTLTATSANAEGRTLDVIPEEKRARFPQGLPPKFEKVANALDPQEVDRVEIPEMSGNCPPESE